MKLSAEFIAQECLEDDLMTGIPNPEECRFSGIRFYVAGMETPFVAASDILYLLFSPEASCPLFSEKTDAVFLLRRSQIPEPVSGLNAPGYISVPDDSDFSVLADRIQDLFLTFTDWYRELYESCILGSNLQELVNLTEKMTPNHIYISDMSFRVTAYTDKEIMREISSTWNYQLKYGYYPLHVIKKLIETGEMERMKRCRKPVLFYSPNFAVPFTCKNIYFANRPQAHLFVVNCMKRPCARDYVVTELFGDFINKYYYLLPEARTKTTEKYYESFLDDTLRGVIEDPDVIEKQIRILGWSMSGEYCMAILDVSTRDTAFVQLARYYLEKNCEYVYFLSGGYLIVLITSPAREREALKRLLEPLSDNYTLDICIGNSFSGFMSLREQYEILVRILKIAKSYNAQQHFVEAQCYSIHYIVDYVAHSPKLRHMVDPGVMVLRRYDEIHETSYFDTLLTYLSCSCNVIRTAEQLHIHRNTLMYRMGKIRELIGFDENQTSDRLHLQMSLLVQRHEEVMKEE